MDTRELIQAEIAGWDEDRLTRLYSVIRALSAEDRSNGHARVDGEEDEGVLERLLNFRIDAPADLAERIERSRRGE